VRKVVHENMSPRHAFDFYQTAKNQKR
jgi:hypothetical protein